MKTWGARRGLGGLNSPEGVGGDAATASSAPRGVTPKRVTPNCQVVFVVDGDAGVHAA